MRRPSNLTPEKTLDVLIPEYVENKESMDEIKKLCDEGNKEIKKLMEEANVKDYTAGGYTAKYIVSHKDSINEERLMVILKKHNIPGVIKVKEYVDMDALEDYLYKNQVSDEVASDLDSCTESKEIIQLRISKAKKKGD